MSGATPSFLIQSWARACDAVILAWGSMLSIFRMRSLASLVILGHGSLLKFSSSLLLAFMMLLKTADSVLPKKGGRPHSTMYMMTPMDQMSQGGP